MKMKPTNRRVLTSRFARTCLRLCVAPIGGAIKETRKAWRLKDDNLIQLAQNDLIRYFAPMTGAVRGLSRELRRIKIRRIRTIKRR